MNRLVMILFFFLAITASAQSSSDELLDTFKTQVNTDINLALETAFEALNVSEKEKNAGNSALSKKSIGTAYYFKEEYQLAVNYLTEAKKELESLGDQSNLASCNNNLALVYEEVGLYQKAASLYFKNLTYFEQIKDTVRLCKTYNNIGIVYEKNGDYDEALKYYNYALEANDTEDLSTIASLTLNIAIVHDLKNDLKIAEDYYLEAINRYSALENDHYLAYVYGNLSAMYLKSGELEKALLYQQKSYDIEKLHGNVQFLTFYNFAHIYSESNELIKAQRYADTAYVKGKSSGNLTDFYHVVSLLKVIHQKKQNYKQALEYSEELIAIKNKLTDDLKTKELEKLNIEYETERKEKEILQLESDRIIANQEIQLQKYYRNGAIVVVLIGVLVILLLINRMKIKKRLYRQNEILMMAKEAETKLQLENKKLENLRIKQEQRNTEELNRIQTERFKAEIDHKNRELSSSALATSQKNELLIEIDEKLKELVKVSNLKLGKELKELKSLIKENKTTDTDWENFKVHFDNVHPNFYTKLTLEFPELSHNDLKHCAYIKVNLTSKEIARIMNISPKSVQMVRYRLKKKFGLNPEQDLIRFIDTVS